MVMLLTLHQMEFIFVNLSDLLEHLVMLQTSTLVKIFNFINFLNKPICIINFANVCLSCIADALTWYVNSMADLNLLRQGLSKPEFCGDLVIN